MRVKSLYLCNFRNLDTQEIFLGEGLNEFVGENAQGKTAFLEAFHALVLGNSFRTFQFKEVLAHGKEDCFLKAVVFEEGVHTTLSFQYNKEGRKVTINGVLQASSAALLGNLLGVTCSLQDNELIYGPPSLRRRYLDQQIAQIDPFYVEQLRRYTRALLQRNRLLRSGELRVIRAFEEQMAKAATYLIEKRRATIEALQKLVVPLYHRLFGSMQADPFSIRYQTQCSSSDIFGWHMDQYEKRREREAKMMMSLVGPHRDDLDILLNGYLGKIVGSFGQIRAICLSLRFAEWELLKIRSTQLPIFLIDDVTSAFDSERIKKMIDMCHSFGQVFVSNCVSVSPSSTKFIVDRGKIHLQNLA